MSLQTTMGQIKVGTRIYVGVSNNLARNLTIYGNLTDII